MHWHLILEEYAPEFIYLKGEHNIIANALNQLELNMPVQTPEMSQLVIRNLFYMADHFTLEVDDLPDDAFLYNINTLHSTNEWIKT
jgi:hypothetical protein